MEMKAMRMNKAKGVSIDIASSGITSLKHRQVGDENVRRENIWREGISGKRHSKETGLGLVCVSKILEKPEWQKQSEGRGWKIKVEGS